MFPLWLVRHTLGTLLVKSAAHFTPHYNLKVRACLLLLIHLHLLCRLSQYTDVCSIGTHCVQGHILHHPTAAQCSASLAAAAAAAASPDLPSS